MYKVYIYIFDTLADWEIGYVTAELNSKRFFKKDAPSISVKTVSITKEPVKSMGGLNIIPDCVIDDITIDKNTVLILPGGNTWDNPKHKAIIDIATKLLSIDSIVCAICGATVALANAGLIDKRSHTSNGVGFLEMFSSNYKGKVNPFSLFSVLLSYILYLITEFYSSTYISLKNKEDKLINEKMGDIYNTKPTINGELEWYHNEKAGQLSNKIITHRESFEYTYLHCRDISGNLKLELFCNNTYYVILPVVVEVIFEDNSSNKNEYKASIIIECSLDDKVSSLFEKYQNKTGNNYNKKIFAFENFELLPDLTIEEASLYTGCTIKVYDA